MTLEHEPVSGRADHEVSCSRSIEQLPVVALSVYQFLLALRNGTEVIFVRCLATAVALFSINKVVTVAAAGNLPSCYSEVG